MRISSNMLTTKYTRQLSSLESRLNDSTTKVTSGSALTRFSDDTTASVRAYKVRSTISNVEIYQSNISLADSSLIDSESALNNMEDLYQYAMSKIVEGQNGTQSADERKIIAGELHSLQQEMLATLNTSVSGSYLFGGTNTDSEPFTIDSVSGKLAYNGTVLDNLVDTNPADALKIASLSNDSRYLDIGLNLQFDSSSELVKSSAFAFTIQGIDIIGYGKTTTTATDGTSVTASNNLYDLLGQIADAFESDTYSYETVDTLYGQFQDSSDGILNALTNVGAKTNYLGFMKERYTTQSTNLEEKQSEIEDVDLAVAIIEYKTNEVAYNAALQMGVNVIRNSIFDYMS